MSDEAVGITDSAEKGSFSRRNALKAGVAVGVGAAAWSGATITSLGGTPAFAGTGCTGVIHVDLSGGCRNTDQGTPCPGGGEFRYHTLNSVSPPFSLANNPIEGTCCDEISPQPVLSWTTPNVTCKVHIQIYSGGLEKCRDKTGPLLVDQSSTTVGGAGGGQVTVPMSCFGYEDGVKLPSNSFYTIFANCASNGAPQSCL